MQSKQPPSARYPYVPGDVADALYIACRMGQEAAAGEPLGHAPDLSFRAFDGGTALHWAYSRDRPQ